MSPQQIQSDVSSARRGAGVALGFVLCGLVLLVVSLFVEAGRVALGMALVFLVLAALQLWQCRHELVRLWGLLEDSKSR